MARGKLFFIFNWSKEGVFVFIEKVRIEFTRYGLCHKNIYVELYFCAKEWGNYNINSFSNKYKDISNTSKETCESVRYLFSTKL